ncbi:MAG TPA: LssY C-terminal domain-containing protein [Candidatus Omnitrophota bacterium]|nr:LssY C-terminal domain-containing protein [Candidatus Omnitrophota bacterium]
MKSARDFRKWLCLILIQTLILPGCVSYHPHSFQEVQFMRRAQTKETNGIRVTTAVLTDKESKKLFGVNIAKKGIQAVWLKIENSREEPYIFLQQNLDPDYYSPEEAAYICHYSTAQRFIELGVVAIVFFPVLFAAPVTYFSARYSNKKMDSDFEEKGLHNNIVMPKSTFQGFVFTPLDEGTKEVKIALHGDEGDEIFNFFFKVPGIRADYRKRKFDALYPENEIRECSEAELQSELLKIAATTTNKKGTARGDPLNLVIIGELNDILNAFASARWSETESLGFKSSYKTAKAFLFGKTYRYSPVSPLYYDGRSQDIALQKPRKKIDQRLHLRLWFSPLRVNSKPVWIGAISRDIGVRFTLKTWNLTTHKIDPYVDDARDYVIQDLASVEKVVHYGFAGGVGVSTKEKPGKNLTGDPYITDGYRMVIEVSEHRSPLTSFNWKFPDFEKED